MMMLSGVTQPPALVPADDGAVVVAPVALKLMVAVSVLPTESVSTSVSVPLPVDVTFTADKLPPETMCTAPLAVHE